MESVTRQRPRGVSVISVLLFIGAALYILGGVLLLAVGGASNSGVIGTLGTVLGVVFIVLGLLNAVLGWGLWTLKPWAFWFAVVIEALSLISSLYQLVVSHNSSFSTILSLVIAAVILIYLFADRNVRPAFRT